MSAESVLGDPRALRVLRHTSPFLEWFHQERVLPGDMKARKVYGTPCLFASDSNRRKGSRRKIPINAAHIRLRQSALQSLLSESLYHRLAFVKKPLSCVPITSKQIRQVFILCYFCFMLIFCVYGSGAAMGSWKTVKPVNFFHKIIFPLTCNLTLNNFSESQKEYYIL